MTTGSEPRRTAEQILLRAALIEAREAIHNLCLERGSTEGYRFTFQTINGALGPPVVVEPGHDEQTETHAAAYSEGYGDAVAAVVEWLNELYPSPRMKWHGVGDHIQKFFNK
jgi:hypothetical protein